MELSDSEDAKSGPSSVDLKKDARAQHNALERRRRDNIKEMYGALKEALPEMYNERPLPHHSILTGSANWDATVQLSEKAAKAQILENPDYRVLRRITTTARQKSLLEQDGLENGDGGFDSKAPVKAIKDRIVTWKEFFETKLIHDTLSVIPCRTDSPVEPYVCNCEKEIISVIHKLKANKTPGEELSFLAHLQQISRAAILKKSIDVITARSQYIEQTRREANVLEAENARLLLELQALRSDNENSTLASIVPYRVKADEEMGESSSMGVTKEIFEQQKRHDLDPILTNRHFWHFMTEKEQLEFLMKREVQINRGIVASNEPNAGPSSFILRNNESVTHIPPPKKRKFDGNSAMLGNI
ncbi:unnamed protein product [Dracunculus medinensis]|uniref:BHLH domain-containing protein n=1 Tax=Dracunculus medinensis TaxID=318479 RepID=A0A0N4U4D8_DRAME|nr:unnamed protein product [Dracunculus medinensis]